MTIWRPAVRRGEAHPDDADARFETLAPLSASQAPAKHLARKLLGSLAAFDHDDSIHQRRFEPFGVLVRLGEGRAVSDVLGVEDDDVREERFGEPSPAGQRRFESLTIDTPVGSAYPCIGVYTIGGRACGIYGRLSRTPVVTYAAADVAVLVEEESE